MVDLPPMFDGVTGGVITLLQVLVAATLYSAETNPKTRARYSKFSRANSADDAQSSRTWPSRFAMMVIYTPALLATSALLALGLRSGDVVVPGALPVPSKSLAAVFCVVHFAKRCLEVLFLHRYSGRTNRETPAQISVYYTLVSILVVYGAGRKDHGHGIVMSTMALGTTLFAVGIAGNFYHHILLARLRTEPGSSSLKKYVAPRGGLFSFVAAPHYLFELIGWLGIAIVSHHMNVYLVFAGMCSYLSGRSVAQNDFNRRKFKEEDWPAHRKNLIPFLF